MPLFATHLTWQHHLGHARIAQVRGSASQAERATRLGAYFSLATLRPVARTAVAAAFAVTSPAVAQSGISKTGLGYETGPDNRLLMGEDGARRVVVNSVGREIRTLDEVPPVEGRRVRLSINYAMQRAAEEAFRAHGFWGAAVVLDPRNGDVLTLASLPAASAPQ